MDKSIGLIGMARRAGKLALGDAACAAAIKNGNARLILLASDAAENISKKARRLAGTANIPLLPLPFSKAEIGRALGYDRLSVVCVLDAGFAEAILKKLPEDE